jgi:hypothetical protein
MFQEPLNQLKMNAAGQKPPGKSRKRMASMIVKSFLLIFITLLFASCYKEPWYGYNGRPGEAFLALNWVDDKPDYIDAGTGSIPPVFQYGRYYRAYPGFYVMYYEGNFWNGQAHAFYAWEIDYEIWIMPGEPGGMYYNGANGPDNYFSIECSPYGPWIYGPGYKEAGLPEGYELKENSGDEIVMEKKGTDFGITVTWKKVVPRRGNP